VRYFKKGIAPGCLTAAKRKAGATFEGIEHACKNEIRRALGRDQGWLCCYCMQRIEDDRNDVKVEHRRSQSDFPSLQLEWKNMLVACRGGEGKPPVEQHCDTRKGSRSISLDPSTPDIEDQVRYSTDGRVLGDNQRRDDELNKVLGLNQAFLCNNRKATLDGFIEALSRRNSHTWSVKMLQNEIRALETPTKGRLTPYLGVVVWWIRKKLSLRRR